MHRVSLLPIMTLFRRLFALAAVIRACLLFAFEVTAQELTVKIEPNPISVGERFTVSFTATSPISDFRAPDFTGLTLLSGPTRTENSRLVNGINQSLTTYAFTLQGRAEGAYTIAPAFANADGKRIQSKFTTAYIVKPNQRQDNAHAPQESSAESERISQLQKSIFLKVSVNKNDVLRGEQIVATYKLYTRITLVNYTQKKTPSFTGFWSQDIANPQLLHFTDEVLNGQIFRVAEVKKVALFPQQSGLLEIDQMEAEVVARVKSDNSVGSRDPFSVSEREISIPLRSPSINVMVRALPQDKAPANFTGAVGTFTLETNVNTTKTKTNEPIKFTVRIAGRGNLKLIDPPKLQVSPDIEVYEPVTRDNILMNEDGAAGSKVFEYLLTPKFAGKFTIPPIDFTYFDLEKKRYATQRSEEYTLTVEKGKDESPLIGQRFRKDAVASLNNDIRFIKNHTGRLPRRGEGFWGSAWFFVLAVLPFVSFFAFVVYRRRLEKLRQNAALMKNKTANRIADKRLKQAYNHLKESRSALFYDAVAQALWGYLGDKLNIPLASLSRSSVETALKENGINSNVVEHLYRVLDVCEIARFAQSQAGDDSMQDVYDNAINVISAIEEELN
jgi:hypothetical protein